MRFRLLLAALLLLPTLAQATFDSVINADTPLPYSWWHLDETSGTAAADSGSGSNLHGATYTGGFTLQQTGISGNGPTKFGVALNGTTGYVNGTTSTATLVIQDTASRGTSFEAWVKPTACATGTRQMVFSNANSSTPAFEWEIYQNAATSDWQSAIYTVTCTGSNYSSITAGTCNAGSYQQLVWTVFSGSGVTLVRHTFYENGAQIGQNTSFSGQFCNTPPTTWALGARPTTPSLLFGGTIDEYLWYRDDNASATGNELTSTQVLAHYNAGVSGGVTAWPYTVRRPSLPDFRDDIYWSAFVNGGYNSGRLERNFRVPLFFTPAFVSFDKVPNGHGL